MAGTTLAPGGPTEFQSLAFRNPNRVQFTYDLVFLGKLNQAPAITTVPVVEALAGRPLRLRRRRDRPRRRPAGVLAARPARPGMAVDRRTGLLSWAPTAADLGTHDVILRVEDGRGGFAEQRFVVSAIDPPPNRPPCFTSVPVVDATVSPPAGSPIILDFEDLPRETRVVDQYKARGVVFTTVPTSLGAIADFTLGDHGVEDFGSSGRQAVDVGNAPAVTKAFFVDPATGEPATTDLVSIRVGDGDSASESFQVSFYDLDGGLLDSQSYTTNAGLITGGVTVRYEGSGIARRRVRALPDQSGFSFDDFTFNPVRTSCSYIYQSTANDPDDDSLTFSLATHPAGMTVDAATGLVSWNPAASQVGLVPVLLQVSDGRGGTATQSFTIDVRPDPTNHPPVIVSPPVTTAVAGQPYTYDVEAIDPDGDPLTYSLTTPPSGMTIDPNTGHIDWTETGLAPQLGFAFGAGSSGNDLGHAIATDSAGNVYVAGSFSGTVDFDPASGVANLTSAGSDDAFAAKYTPTGSLLWARRFGGSGQDLLYSIAVDEAQNVYLAGTGGTQVLKLDSGGNLLWMHNIGVQAGYTNSIAADRAGNVYVTGVFQGTVDFDPGPGVDNLTSVGQQDGFIWKLDGAGNLVWARQVGGATDGPNADYAQAIAVDDAGNVFVTGHFYGTADFDPSTATYNLTSAGLLDVFVLELDDQGRFGWVSRLGGSLNDVVEGLALDPTGNVIVAGYVADFETSSNPTGHSVTFIAKFDDTGSLSWTRTVGGSSDRTESLGLRVDGYGAIYIAGQFRGSADFDPGPGVYSLDSPGNFDAFTLKLDGVGDLVWVSRVSGTSFVGATDLALDRDGDVYTTGSFLGTADFDPGDPTLNLDSAGGGDLFVAKLIPTPLPQALVVVRVEDGRGGFDEQSFTIDVVNDRPGEIRGRAFQDGTYSPVTATLTVDNKYGIYHGTADGQILTFAGRNEVGPVSEWPSPETWTFNVDMNDYIYVVAWDYGPPHMFIGDFRRPDGVAIVSNLTDWMFVVGNGPNPGTSGDVPPLSTLMSDISTGTWDTPRVSMTQPSSFPPASPWGQITGISPSALFIWHDDFLNSTSNSHYAIFRSKEPVRAWLGIPNWTVYLDQNQNGRLDPGEQSTMTDSEGNYSFPNLAPGTYTVAEEPQTWLGPNDSSHADLRDHVESGQVVTGIDFGNQPSTGSLPNRPPSFTSTPPPTALVGQPLIYRASATDPDGDPLTYDLVVRPAGMAVDPTTGVVVWTPTPDQDGAQNAILRVSDGHGGVALQTFQIAVRRANTHPDITSIPRGPAVVGRPWEYQVRAQDADGDPITFSLGAHPDGMTIDPSTGLVTWTPAADQVGSHAVEIIASDNRGASITQSFDLPAVATATDRAAVDHVAAPRHRSGWAARTATPSTPTTPTATRSSFSLPVHPDGMTIDPKTGLVTWTPDRRSTRRQPGQGPRRGRPRRLSPSSPSRSACARRTSTTPPSIISTPPFRRPRSAGPTPTTSRAPTRTTTRWPGASTPPRPACRSTAIAAPSAGRRPATSSGRKPSSSASRTARAAMRPRRSR